MGRILKDETGNKYGLLVVVELHSKGKEAICEEWRSFDVFYEWAITNGYKEGLSIDRINNNGNYEPSNCWWATQSEQMLNQDRSLKNRDKYA